MNTGNEKNREVREVIFEILTQEKLRDEIDQLSRRDLGLPVDEFLQRFHDGIVDLHSPKLLEITLLARLLDHAESGLEHLRASYSDL